jgi:limonene-1,2-epoxide hydrolase
MTPNEQLVVDFLHGWGPNWDGIVANYEKYVADDFFWFNAGLPECHSKAQGMEFIAGLNDIVGEDGGYGSVDFEIVNVVSKGDFVVTERIDNNLTGNGNTIGGHTKVLGIFEVRDGQIKSWRDYFDPRGFLAYFPDAS